MKLGTKITLGFASLIIIALLLGGLAVWKMTGVKRAAAVLSAEYMPAAMVANNVERESLRTMYEMRGYALTEDTNYLVRAEGHLAGVKGHVKAATELATKSGAQHLAFMQEAAERAGAKVLEYDQLGGRTVAVNEALARDRGAMDQAAGAYMEQCTHFLVDQAAALQQVLKATNGARVEVAQVQDRVAKMGLANDIIDLGNAIRVGNFKAQATRDPELFRETQKRFAEVDRKLDALKAITVLEEHQKAIEACRGAGHAYDAAMTSFLKNWLEREDLNRRRAAIGSAVLDEARETATVSMETSAKTSSAAAAALGTAATTMVGGLIAAVLIGVLLAAWITRSITGPIRQVANHLAAGAEQTASAAGQVSASSQSLAQGASEQAASLEETSSSLEELASMTRRNAENSQRANDLAKEARAAAERGSRDMQAMSSAMEAIKVSSDDIAKIIKTIDEIAFQTNILALNAAVEAARAGEAGMGFAVVADEVRSLAHRSAQAAKETAVKIEGAIGKTAQGVDISAKVAAVLNEIVAKARQVDELAAEVAGASREQTQGISQINTAVGQMDKVTQSNASNAEESAASAEELNAQAESLKEAVSGLLGLVDGHGRLAPGVGDGAAPRRSGGWTRPVVPPAQRPARTNGKNGKAPRIEAPPADGEADLAAGNTRRNEIPLEGQFRSF